MKKKILKVILIVVMGICLFNTVFASNVEMNSFKEYGDYSEVSIKGRFEIINVVMIVGVVISVLAILKGINLIKKGNKKMGICLIVVFVFVTAILIFMGDLFYTIKPRNIMID